MTRTCLVDATTLPVYDLGSKHPFARDRQRALFDLLHTTGLVQAADVLPWRVATDEELTTVHDAAYVACLRAASTADPDAMTLRRALHFGLGSPDNPIAKGQHDAAAAAVGATLACVDAVLDGRCAHALQTGGGLHHAMPHGAAGFCLYNDVAIGIRRARARGCERVLYVDFDVHHGDGVEYAFRGDASVLSLSLHETPDVRYPFTGHVDDVGEGHGRGYALNVPLQPGTADASWLECVERVLVPAVRAFRPDLIVSQHGCDTHREDPLATLECTTRIAGAAAALCRDLAVAHCGGRWVATGGGGYQPVRVIPRAWGLVWAEMSRRTPPAELPPEWLARWQPRADGELPTSWFDAEQRSPRHQSAASANRRTVDRLLSLVPWLTQ